MALLLRELLTMWVVPSASYYRRRIAEEAEWGEHELLVLGEVVAAGGTAIDVGANKGFFAYAFSPIVQRVEAFEPNPDYARFARRMLGSRATVHEVALSDRSETAEFFVPIADDGTALHLGGNLKHPDAGPNRSESFAVSVRTLDSYQFTDVRVIKVDVEGSEMQVLAGARDTILRDRPPLIVELLTGAHNDPLAQAEIICTIYGYNAWLVTKDGTIVDAAPAIRRLDGNTTWGSPIRNRNVLFLPRP